MVFFNYALRKLNAKIVYYGPGLCGKTTNLVWIHDNFEGGDRGKMISLATEGDRTIRGAKVTSFACGRDVEE